jgi:hypothetical protein
MHREVVNCPKDLQVDHKDGNGLNNSKLNLRIVTHKQNNQYKSLTSANTSGFKGAFFCKYRSHLKTPWRSLIRYENKSIHLGCFETAEEAHEAYKLAAKKYYGEFAKW